MAVAGRVLLATLAVLVATVPAGSAAARPAHRAVTVPAPPGGAAPVDGFRSVRTFDLVAEPARLRIPAVQVDTALQLVTCGGTFDHRAGSYRDNVIVYTVPS